jgi:hypothetical protein
MELYFYEKTLKNEDKITSVVNRPADFSAGPGRCGLKSHRFPKSVLNRWILTVFIYFSQ